MIRLSERTPDLEEIMDRDDCDAEALERTYQAFVHINRWLSGWGRLYTRYLRPLLEQETVRRRAQADQDWKNRNDVGHYPLRIVDVGCGGGDVLRYVVGRARRDGFHVEGLGVDPDGRAIRYARDTARRTGGNVAESGGGTSLARAVESRISFLEGRLEDVAGPVDVIISNHLLHHLTDHEVRQLLAASAGRAALACIHNDIARSWPALVLFQFVRPLFPRTFIGVDGTRSIRRAFTRRELLDVAGPGWKPVEGAPFRVGLLYLSRDSAVGSSEAGSTERNGG